MQLPTTSSQESASPPPAVINAFPDVFQVAWKSRYWLVVAMILGVGLGRVLYWKAGPAYLANAQILVSKRTTVPIKNAAESVIQEDRTEHIALILSPLIVQEAVEKFGLGNLSTLIEEDFPADEIIDQLRVKRTAGQDRSVLNVLSLNYLAENREDAEKVLEGVIGAYKSYLSNSREAHVSESVKLIRQASEELLKQLRAKETEYLKFRKESPLFWKSAPGLNGQQGEATNVYQERMLAIETERRTTIFKQTEVESRIKSLEQALEENEPRESLELLVRRMMALDGSANTSAVPTQEARNVADLQRQLIPLLMEETQLTRSFGKDYGPLKTLRNKITKVKEFYREQGIVLPEELENPANVAQPPDFVKLYIESMKQQVGQLKLLEKRQEEIFNEVSAKAKEYTAYQIQDEGFNSDLKRMKLLWDTVMVRLNEVKFVEDNGGYSLEVISPPRAELDGKKPLKYMAMGSFAAVGMAFCLCYLLALRDRTLKSVDELRQMGLPIVGQIPSFHSEISVAGSNLHPSLCFAHRPGSAEAEAYRSLRTALYFSTHGPEVRTLQVSSPESEDGKSTMCANLALALANSGKRILLVDADLRRARLHELFGISDQIGLSDILTGEIECENAVRVTFNPNLWLLPAGISPANPAELLGSLRFEELLNRLKAEYDLVIIDTPPLLAVTDPMIVAGRADGLLLVLRIGKNTRSSIQRVHELLSIHGVVPVGIAANGVITKEMDSYSYKYVQGKPELPPALKPIGNA